MASVRKLLLALLFILPVLGLGIPAALAAGRINALTAAPNPTLENKPVTFSVQGTGNCHFRLNFGAGAPPLTATVPLPYQPPTHSTLAPEPTQPSLSQSLERHVLDRHRST